jgi:hypothetical protein
MKYRISFLQTLIIGFFLISFASAIILEAGDSYFIDLGKNYSYYEVKGNTSLVNLEVLQNGTIVEIKTDKYSQPDVFDIVFYDEKGEVINNDGGSSGGSGGGWGSRDNNVTINKPIQNNTKVLFNASTDKYLPEEDVVISREVKNYNFIYITAFSFALSFIIVYVINKFLKTKNKFLKTKKDGD